MSKKDSKKPENQADEQLEAEEVKTEVEEKEASPLEKLQKEFEQLNDRLLRTLAEYDNYRKRSQKEKETAFGDSKADVINKMLPVMDNFERALDNKDASAEDLRKGLEMIYAQLSDFLSKQSVEAFGEKGEQFNPNIHNAVMHIEDENEEENTIVEVFSKGYKMGDRIIRPAMVKVAN